MRKIPNFCGIFAENRLRLSRFRVNSLLHSACTIFATLFVTTTIILLASCSQDDDYYDNSEMCTLAGEMGTRSGGGDPGGQPSPVITYVTEEPKTEFHEMYFYPDSVFYSSDFQHSPLVAIDPSLYNNRFLEEDIWIEIQRVDNVPTVTSFTYSPSVVSFGYWSNYTFQVTSTEFRLLENSIPNKYILYATGGLLADDGSIIPFTAFIPNRIYN